MYAILLQKSGGKQDGQHSGSNQQAGQRDDKPKLPVTLFQLRELLADASKKALGSTRHFRVARQICSCYQPSLIGTMGYAVHYESKQIGRRSSSSASF